MRTSGLDGGTLSAAFVLSFFILSCNYTKRYLYRYRRSRCANISDRGWDTHHSDIRVVKIIYAGCRGVSTVNDILREYYRKWREGMRSITPVRQLTGMRGDVTQVKLD